VSTSLLSMSLLCYETIYYHYLLWFILQCSQYLDYVALDGMVAGELENIWEDVAMA
jgi:hypothetical protein